MMSDDSQPIFDAEQSKQHNQPPKPLSATDYPIWVILFGLGAVFLFGQATVSLPHDIALARALHKAQRLEQAGNYVQAEQAFSEVMRVMPASKTARLGFAKAIFEDNDPQNDNQGVEALEGLKLDKYEWADVSKHMPEKYRALFSKGN